MPGCRRRGLVDAQRTSRRRELVSWEYGLTAGCPRVKDGHLAVGRRRQLRPNEQSPFYIYYVFVIIFPVESVEAGEERHFGDDRSPSENDAAQSETR